MPEILRDLMKPMLSLKHLCCQEIVTRFWCNRQPLNFPIVSSTSYYRRFQNAQLEVELPQFISALGVPKTLETDLFEIGIFMIPELRKVIAPLEFNCWFSQLGSSLISFNPTGGIKLEETYQNILQQPQMERKWKLFLAHHFCVFDPTVADNVESYIPMLRGHDPHVDLSEWHPHMKSKPHEILSHIPDISIWGLKHTWKNLSQHDKEQLSGSLDQHVIILEEQFAGDPICDFLMDNLFTEKIHNFWKLCDSEDPVDVCCFDYQISRFLDYLVSPFCYLDRNSTNLLKKLRALPDATFTYILIIMTRRIILEYDDVLYRYLYDIWHGHTDSFKQNFCTKNEQFLKSLLHDHGHHNIDYAGRILLLLQPFNQKLKVNTSPDFLGYYLRNSLHQPFRPPDKYLNTFLDSKDKIAVVKKEAIWMDEVRAQILNNMGLPELCGIASEVTQWALATNEERDEYITALYRDAHLLVWNF